MVFCNKKIPISNPLPLQHQQTRLIFTKITIHQQQLCGSGQSMSTLRIKGKSLKVVVWKLTSSWQLGVCRIVVQSD